MSHSGAHRLYQRLDTDDGNGAPEIIGKRRQAELAAHVGQALHEEGSLVHPLLDRAERMFDRFTPCVENARSGGEPMRHAVEHRFAFPAFNPTGAAACALWLQRATLAGRFVAVKDGAMPVSFRTLNRIETLAARTAIKIACCIIGELMLGEAPSGDSCSALWPRNIG